MGIQNSHVKEIILGLYRETILDLHDTILTYKDQLPAYRYRLESDRDIQYVVKRTEAEGLSFVTTVLPRLGKHLDSLLSGKASAWPDGLGGAFLRSAFDVVENIMMDYLLRDSTDVFEGSTTHGKFIRKLRTILYLSYKLELPPSPESVQRKLDEFKATEVEVSEFALPADNRYVEMARHALDFIVGGFDPSCNVFPKHGPGAVATGEKGDDKWVFTHLYESLHRKYPYYDFMYGMRSNGRALHLASSVRKYREMIKEPYPVAKLCIVPKDSRGPRIISCEPLELQFMQQGVAIRLMSHLERLTSICDDGCSTPLSHINFLDQSINANLALSASRTRKWATIDLSEASDRVSQVLFRGIWPESQQPYFEALRSHATIFPNGEVLRLEKFAPMGSALCFPVESAIFYALSVAAIQVTGCSFTEACRGVFVYGDDIIVKTEYAATVMSVLEGHGLKVNGLKSFTSGYFRESCGMDAWHGQRITPVRIRKLPGEYPHSGSEHSAWAAYAGHFYEAEMPRAGSFCKEVVELVLGEFIPFTDQDNGYLSVIRPGHASPLKEYRQVQWSPDLSLPTAMVWTLKTKSKPSKLDGYERLLRNILTAHPSRDPNQVVVPNATKMSRTRRGLTPFSVYDWFGMQE